MALTFLLLNSIGVASCFSSCSFDELLLLCYLLLGSLLNLAKHPASTVQLLGAEKALFRALKTKRDTPKFGLIYHASLVGQTNTKNKGKVSCRVVYQLGFFHSMSICRWDGLSFTVRLLPWLVLPYCFVVMWKMPLSHKSLDVTNSCSKNRIGLSIQCVWVITDAFLLSYDIT